MIAGVNSLEEAFGYVRDREVREKLQYQYEYHVNECPVCGGWIKVESEVKVEYCFHDNCDSLDSTDNEIVEQIYQKTPVKTCCLECGAILDVTYTDAEKREFTLRAEV